MNCLFKLQWTRDVDVNQNPRQTDTFTLINSCHFLLVIWLSALMAWVKTDCAVGRAATSGPPLRREYAEEEVRGTWGRLMEEGIVVRLGGGKQTGWGVSMNRLRCYPCGNGAHWYWVWPLRFDSQTSAGCFFLTWDCLFIPFLLLSSCLRIVLKLHRESNFINGQCE